MAEKNKTAQTDLANKTISIKRVFDAPVGLLFKVWTEPGHIAKWWGPNGFTNTIDIMDVRPGGTWEFVMHGPDGTDYKNKSVYKEIRKNEYISFNHVSGPKFEAHVTFTAIGDKTELHWEMVFESLNELEQVVKVFKADEGLTQNTDKLAVYLLNVPADDEFTYTRVFKAPIELVYKMWTDAEHLAQWWGPAGFKMGVTKLDLRPGGMFLYSMSAPDGQLMWGRFVYREIVSPERIVFISSFADENGNIIRAPFSDKWPLEVLNILSMVAEGNTTRVTLRGKPINAGVEENNLYSSMFSSMQQGFGGTFDQLEAHLAVLQKS